MPKQLLCQKEAKCSHFKSKTPLMAQLLCHRMVIKVSFDFKIYSWIIGTKCKSCNFGQTKCYKLQEGDHTAQKDNYSVSAE